METVNNKFESIEIDVVLNRIKGDYSINYGYEDEKLTWELLNNDEILRVTAVDLNETFIATIGEFGLIEIFNEVDEYVDAE